MLSHAVVNASGGLVLLPGLLGLGYDMKRSSHMLHMPWPILLPGAVLALVGCLLVWRALGAGPLEGDDAPPAPSAPTGAGGARLVGSVIALLAAIVIAVMAGAWRDMGEGLQRLKPVDPKPLAGCYRLELNSRSDEAAVGFVAPVRLRLSLERYRWQDDQPATFRVQPLEGPAVTRDGGPAFWIPRRGGQVSVIAERQQTVLRMHRSGRDLAGDLVTYDRATGSVVSGSATARWIACPGNTSRGR